MIIVKQAKKIKRDTIQKHIVRRFFQQYRKDFADAHAIYEYAKQIIPTITLATIYRNLDKIIKEGDVEAIPLVSGKNLYALRSVLEGKMLFFCEHCDHVSLLPSSSFLPKPIELQNTYSLRVSTVRCRISGLCHACKHRA